MRDPVVRWLAALAVLTYAGALFALWDFRVDLGTWLSVLAVVFGFAACLRYMVK